MYLLGIDNGGSDIKCAVYDLNGKELAISRTQIPMNIPEAGFTERDVENVWEANVKVIKAVLKKAEIPGEDVVAIGVTGYGNGMVLLDEEGKPVYPAIISTDERASSYCKKFREDGTEKKIFPYTLQTTWAAQPAVLLPWFRDHKPEVLEKTKWIMSMKDYIRFRLTGKVAGEITDASSGCLVNLDTRRYDRRIFEILGIEDCYSKMPKILESTDISGYVTKEAEKMTGLTEGTPVAAGYFDIDANALASGVLSDQELCLIAGTWSINEYLSKEAPREIEKKKNTVTLSYMKDYYIMEDSTPTSASNLNWYLNHFVRPEKQELSADEIYIVCNKQVESVKPEECKVIFVPYLFGSATHENAHGAFLNLTGGDDKSVMLRAVYEGVVFSHYTHVRKLLLNREKPKAVQLSGGAANSDVWVQIFADVLQIPVEVMEDKELGAMGAAITAGIAAGVYQDYGEAIKRTVRIKKTVYPRSEYAEIYEQKYRQYQKVIEALDSVWDEFRN